MTWLEALAVLGAGMAAGTINTIVGSGTLITFPTLLALGYPPVVANVSNTVGLVPGSVTGAIGYRRGGGGARAARGGGGGGAGGPRRGAAGGATPVGVGPGAVPGASGSPRAGAAQRARLLRLGVASLAGGVTGAVLLLTLPASAFDAIVPVLIGIGCVLVVLQPWVSSKISRPHDPPPHGSMWVWLGVFLVGIYGGYFGAAQGVLLMAIMGIGLDESVQRLNASKNVLAGLVNGVDWLVALLIAGGSVVGGVVGAHVGRRLAPWVLRGVIVVVGAVAVWRLLFF